VAELDASPPPSKRDGPALQLPGVTLVVTDGAAYKDTVQQLLRRLHAQAPSGVFITANRPYEALRTLVDQDGLEGIRFLDCVSALTGVPPASRPDAQFIESPTLLEKTALRAEVMLQRLEGPRFLVVDSLSTLAVYNDPRAVAEWVHHLVNRMRLQNVPVALILVERQAPPALLDLVSPLCDQVTRH
jgi:hypothetical protein